MIVMPSTSSENQKNHNKISVKKYERRKQAVPNQNCLP